MAREARSASAASALMERINASWLARFDMEKACITFSLTWGSWLLWWQPLSGIPGLRFLVLSASWMPIKPDIAWGGLMVTLACLRMSLIHWVPECLFCRAVMALTAATIYLIVTALIAVDSHMSTGIPCYGIIAFMNGIVFAQLLMVKEVIKRGCET
jgi:hypothetical protein